MEDLRVADRRCKNLRFPGRWCCNTPAENIFACPRKINGIWTGEQVCDVLPWRVLVDGSARIHRPLLVDDDTNKSRLFRFSLEKLIALTEGQDEQRKSCIAFQW